jgi:hypothetical protein
MAKWNVLKCDICGVEQVQDASVHWTNRIAPAVLSLKEHISIQQVPFEGDCCATCGRGLVSAITAYIKSRQTEGSAPTTNTEGGDRG